MATKDHGSRAIYIIIIFQEVETCFFVPVANGRSFFQRQKNRGFHLLVHVVTISVRQGCQKVSKSPHEARHLDLIRELSAKNREKEERVLDA